MFVHIHDIRKSRGLSKTFEFEGPLVLSGLKLLGAIRLDLKLTNAGSRIVVEGPYSVPVELVCCRCAEAFEQRLETEVEEFFVPEDSPEVSRGSDKELDNVFTFTDERIQLDELLRQEAVAAIPMQPLCREDCKGLCDTCGVNLNKETCSCAPEEYDPRWEALARLKEASPARESNDARR